MLEKIKDLGYSVLGIGFFILIIVAFALLIIGGAKLFEILNPILEWISSVTWGIVWLLLLLSIIPRFRNFTGTGIILGTYIGGTIFWLLSFYITFSLWGFLGIFVGVLFFGLGVYVTAILALLFDGQFTGALGFMFVLAQIFIFRFLGFWIISKYKPKQIDEVQETNQHALDLKESHNFTKAEFKYCKYCGEQIREGVGFCRFCGKKVSLQGIPVNPKSEKLPKNSFSLLRIIVWSIVVIFILGFLAGIVLVVMSSARETTDLRQQILNRENITASVVNILCADSRENFDFEEGIGLYGGSGTIFNSEGVVLTNSHIIPQDEYSLYTPESGCLVILPNPQSGASEEIYWGEPVVIPTLSDNFDLAFLKIYDVFTDEEGNVYGEYPRTFPSLLESVPIDICTAKPQLSLGEEVRVYGYPQASGGYNLTVTEGVVSAFFDEEGYILTSAKVDAGNSGGLAIDEDGCWIGVPSAIQFGEYQNLGVILSSDTVIEFFNEYESLTGEELL